MAPSRAPSPAGSRKTPSPKASPTGSPISKPSPLKKLYLKSLSRMKSLRKLPSRPTEEEDIGEEPRTPRPLSPFSGYRPDDASQIDEEGFQTVVNRYKFKREKKGKDYERIKQNWRQPRIDNRAGQVKTGTIITAWHVPQDARPMKDMKIRPMIVLSKDALSMVCLPMFTWEGKGIASLDELCYTKYKEGLVPIRGMGDYSEPNSEFQNPPLRCAGPKDPESTIDLSYTVKIDYKSFVAVVDSLLDDSIIALDEMFWRWSVERRTKNLKEIKLQTTGDLEWRPRKGAIEKESED